MPTAGLYNHGYWKRCTSHHRFTPDPLLKRLCADKIRKAPWHFHILTAMLKHSEIPESLLFGHERLPLVIRIASLPVRVELYKTKTGC